MTSSIRIASIGRDPFLCVIRGAFFGYVQTFMRHEE